MAAEQEIRASKEEVEDFVAKLKEFHGTLNEVEQAMLETILEGARLGDDFGDHIWFHHYGGDTGHGWSGIVEYLLEDDESEGFFILIKG
jgi:hypothetical protein